jgi:hypothetical protein
MTEDEKLVEEFLEELRPRTVRENLTTLGICVTITLVLVTLAYVK